MTRRRAALAAAVTVVLLGACGGGNAPGSGSGPGTDALEVSAYVVPWDAGSALTAWKAGAGGVLDGVSPVWLSPTRKGGLVRAAPGATSAVVGRADRASAAVIPSISNYVGGRWDGRLVARLLGDPALRARHVRAIATAVTEHGWDGVDVDYESLPAAARHSFSTFVSELSQKLHAAGAVLTVTVQAKTSPGQGAAYQDWAAIGRAADRVRVMAYDHAWATSRPGPVAPLPWVDKVLAFAVRKIPVEKIELGIAAYGYDWSGRAGASVSWEQARTRAARHGAKVHWEGTSGSAWFSYTDRAGRRHVVWFDDARSARLKTAAARHHGVRHVVVWQLGGADPRIWPVLGAAR